MKRFLLLGVLWVATAANGLAQVAWQKASEEFIFTEAPFRECHASTVVEVRPGKLLAAWFGGSSESRPDVAIWLSAREQGRWTPPVAVADGRINDTLRYATWNPVLFRSRAGTLFLFYKVGPSPREWWGMLKTSPDEGKTWSAPQRLPEGMLGPIKNKPVELADGTLLAPSSVETSDRWRVHLEATRDQGQHWQFIPVDTASAFDVIQPSILVHPGGRLQLLCRSKQGKIIQAWSGDNGKSWGKLTPTHVINPNAGTDAVTLQGGGQLLVYNPATPGKEWFEGRSALKVAVSRDGQTWKNVLDLEKGTTEEFSYPAVIQTRDGRVHITYTYDRKTIKYVVLQAKRR
jgi:alpha-L-fucosidase